MSIERQKTNERASKIVKHNGVVYLSGQVGDGETINEQAEDFLGRVDALLAEAGSSREKMLQAIVWLSDMSYLLNSILYGTLGCLRATPRLEPIEDKAIIYKILTHLDNKRPCAQTAPLPQVRAPPVADLFS